MRSVEGGREMRLSLCILGADDYGKRIRGLRR